MILSNQQKIYPQVRAEIYNVFDELLKWLKKNPDFKYSNFYVNQLNQFKLQPDLFSPLETERIPDGSPIGSIACDF